MLIENVIKKINFALDDLSKIKQISHFTSKLSRNYCSNFSWVISEYIFHFVGCSLATWSP